MHLYMRGRRLSSRTGGINGGIVGILGDVGKLLSRNIADENGKEDRAEDATLRDSSWNRKGFRHTVVNFNSVHSITQVASN